MRMKFYKKNKLGRESGQSLIEYIVVLFGFFTIFFMFFRLSMSLAIGQYIHYVTFMASRVYLASAPDEATQRENARKILVDHLGEDGNRFQPFVKPSSSEAGSGFPGARIGHGPLYTLDRSEFAIWAQEGVSFSFESKLYFAPLIQEVASRAGKKFDLTSESWLGREPTHEECDGYMSSSASSVGGSSSSGGTTGKPWYYDNGC